MLRDAGAVLLAKLTTGELAQGDQWFGGQTKNPWNLQQGSSGSSAGPAAATAGGLVGVRDRHRNERVDPQPGGALRRHRAPADLRPHQPSGVMALSWTQDRLGPMCRHAEDCAVVMSVIAKPDGKDLSVSEIPFNWNAGLDVKKLRVGYLKEGFEESRDAAAKANDEKTLAQLATLGVKLIEVKVPDWSLDVSAYAVESAAFFDELIRSGNDKKMANPGRAAGWKSARLIPAVEYVQLQRARMMLMMKLAEATASVDVYVVPGMGGGTGPPAARRRGTLPAAGEARPRRSPTQSHFTMANLAAIPR